MSTARKIHANSKLNKAFHSIEALSNREKANIYEPLLDPLGNELFIFEEVTSSAIAHKTTGSRQKRKWRTPGETPYDEPAMHSSKAMENAACHKVILGTFQKWYPRKILRTRARVMTMEKLNLTRMAFIHLLDIGTVYRTSSASSLFAKLPFAVFGRVPSLWATEHDSRYPYYWKKLECSELLQKSSLSLSHSGQVQNLMKKSLY